MFPYLTLLFSGLIVAGIIIYQVDVLRLEDKNQESRSIPLPKFIKKAQDFLRDIVYLVGIRIYRTARRIRKKIQGKK